jgi:hypothetical protein
MEAVARGTTVREPERGWKYHAWVDMSGGSNDDATLCIAHLDQDGRAVVDLVMNQGPPPPFDPRGAVSRFCAALQRYGVWTAHADAYAGETFRADFASRNVTLSRADLTASELYEEMEAPLNGRKVVLLDSPLVEQQLLGLVWRGGKIDHPPGEHDDFANAVAGAAHLCLKGAKDWGSIAWSVNKSTDLGVRVSGDERPPEFIRGRYEQGARHPHERVEPDAPEEMSERKRRAWGGA